MEAEVAAMVAAAVDLAGVPKIEGAVVVEEAASWLKSEDVDAELEIGADCPNKGEEVEGATPNKAWAEVAGAADDIAVTPATGAVEIMVREEALLEGVEAAEAVEEGAEEEGAEEGPEEEGADEEGTETGEGATTLAAPNKLSPGDLVAEAKTEAALPNTEPAADEGDENPTGPLPPPLVLVGAGVVSFFCSAVDSAALSGVFSTDAAPAESATADGAAGLGVEAKNKGGGALDDVAGLDKAAETENV